MEKYHIKRINPEYLNFETWEDSAWKEDHVMLFGNRDMTYNEDDYKAIEHAIDSFNIDLDQSEFQLQDDEIDDDQFEKDVTEMVNYYFKKTEQPFNRQEVAKIYRLASTMSMSEVDKVCKLMEFMYRKPFVNGTMHGYSQSDWSNYICPASYDQDAIAYLEGVMMGTGCEWDVPEEKTETLEEIQEKDIWSAAYYTADPYNAEEDLAKQIGCTPEEIVLYDEEGNEL